MDPTPQDSAIQAQIAEIFRRRESGYWKLTAMPMVLRRLESGDFDKNEMRVILHLIRIGCRPWISVQTSAAKIGKALRMQRVKVGAVLKKLVRRGVVEVEEGRLYRAEAVATTRLWGISAPDTWDRPPATVSEEETGSFRIVDDATLAALREMACELEDAAPGQRIPIWDGPKITNWIPEPSTYPEWMGTSKSYRTRQYADRLIELILWLLRGHARPVVFGKKASKELKIIEWLLDRAEEKKARHPDRYIG